MAYLEVGDGRLYYEHHHRGGALTVLLSHGFGMSLRAWDDVTAALTEHRVPHAPVLSPEEAIEHEHFVERGTVRTITDPRLGEVKIAGFPIHSNVPLPPDDHDARFIPHG